MKLPKDVDLKKKGSSGYKPTMVARKSQMGFARGKPVFILDDPDGNPWVMQAYSLIVDPNQTYESLKDLGRKLKLPAGWKFRVKVLDQDLTIRAVDGIAHIVRDDLGENSRKRNLRTFRYRFSPYTTADTRAFHHRLKEAVLRCRQIAGIKE